MKIFNSLTSVKESVETVVPSLRMFVDGPTVYDYSHLGHAKTYTQLDFMVRVLRRTFPVDVLMNITDVDDKIIARANELNVSHVELARKFEAEFFEDMNWLGNTVYTNTARALDYVPEITNQIVRLIDLGHVYRVEGSGWYFDLTTAVKTSSVSGRDFTHSEEDYSRVGVAGKRNAGDFAVWKFVKNNEPFWDSKTLGAGRPGWHIEDTAIIESFFGHQIDIHAGASDLLFPHHEAETIQMEALSQGKLFSRYWVHTGLLNVGDKKMGKSLKNFITIRSLKNKWEPAVLRFFFLRSNYRSELVFNEKHLSETKVLVEKINLFYKEANNASEPEVLISLATKAEEQFFAALDDDFNSPLALSVLFDFMKKVNTEYRFQSGAAVKKFLTNVNDVYRVFNFNEDTLFVEKANSPVVDVQKIEELIASRETFRVNKNWAAADSIRDLLTQMGVVIEDTAAGVRWTAR